LRRAIELTAEDDGALLILSGGQTRAEAGPKSEAQGYLEIARLVDWFGHRTIESRTILEDFSRDSFENLLFSICRFKEHAGDYPRMVTVATWAFKEERFDFHRATIGWPLSRYRFAAVNQPPDLAGAWKGEMGTLAEFRRDPWGVGPVLMAKRIGRNPFGRRHNFETAYPELSPFPGTIRLQTLTDP